MKQLFIVVFLAIHLSAITQNSDDAFKQPLQTVIATIEKRYDVKIRYDQNLVKDKWVTYAGWRFRPGVEATLANTLASQDITFAPDGSKKYKLQNYQYHLKSPLEGKEQLENLSTLY